MNDFRRDAQLHATATKLLAYSNCTLHDVM
jgi:hypothetical protein